MRGERRGEEKGEKMRGTREAHFPICTNRKDEKRKDDKRKDEKRGDEKRR